MGCRVFGVHLRLPLVQRFSLFALLRWNVRPFACNDTQYFEPQGGVEVTSLIDCADAGVIVIFG
jgi:hypothetical protein